MSTLFAVAIEHARDGAERAERAEVAARIREAVRHSGLTNREFARLVGTGGPRLSTYRSGSVTPSAALLLRIERPAANTQRVVEIGSASSRAGGIVGQRPASG